MYSYHLKNKSTNLISYQVHFILLARKELSQMMMPTEHNFIINDDVGAMEAYAMRHPFLGSLGLSAG